MKRNLFEAGLQIAEATGLEAANADQNSGGSTQMQVSQHQLRPRDRRSEPADSEVDHLQVETRHFCCGDLLEARCCDDVRGKSTHGVYDCTSGNRRPG